MANKNSRQIFKRLKRMTPQQRIDRARYPEYGVGLLSLLTPTQYADLFPDYFRKGLPDVSGFRQALTRKSQKEQQQYFDEIDRKLGTASPGGAGGQGKVSNPVRAKEIYDYLMTKPGMDSAHAMGIINNMNYESKFDSGVLITDNNGLPSGGLFQHNGPRFNKMVAYVGSDWRTNWKKQIDFAMTEGQMQTYMNQRFNNASEASVGFTRVFEKPLHTESEAQRRLGSIGSVESLVKTGGGPVTSSSEAGAGAPDFTKYALHGSSQGECGKGVRLIASRMFGHTPFSTEGLSAGGSQYAGSLSKGNNYFQRSGLYKTGRGIGSEFLTSEYLASLPIGTVVSSEGGSRGGHVQIKTGPNQWMSDFTQSGFIKSGYGNFVIHEPNEAGMARLTENGVIQGTGAPSESVTSAPQVAPREVTEVPRAPIDDNTQLQQEVPDTQGAAPQTASVSKPEKTKSTSKTFSYRDEDLVQAIKQTSDYKEKTAGIPDMFISNSDILGGYWSDPSIVQAMQKKGIEVNQVTKQITFRDYNEKDAREAFGINTKFMTEVPPNTPSHAGGGRQKVSGPIHMTHLHKHFKGDTALVTDGRGKRFTVNPDKERITVNPRTGMMDIKPNRQTEQMDMDKLMALIRRQESGRFEGDYEADLKKKKGSKDTASGAYQYNDRTWKAMAAKYDIGKEYKRAIDAPKEIQDKLTETRFKDLRKKGYSDEEIMVTHFTGNRRGIMSRGAQKGNPTPAEYKASMASHAVEYDKSYGPKVASKPEIEPKIEASVAYAPQAFEAPASTPSQPAERPMVQKIQNIFNAAAGVPKAEAEPVQRAAKGPMGPAPDATSAEIGALRQDMQSNFDFMSKTSMSQRPASYEQPDFQHQNMLSSTMFLNKSPLNPTQKRIENNIEQWTGEHYNLGNKN